MSAIPTTLGLAATSQDVLATLALPAYMTDADGRITFFNEAAARFWGRRPEPGKDKWSGSRRLFAVDGTPLAPEECPLALTLKTGQPHHGVEVIVERPDGSRAVVRPHPSLLRDDRGRILGAINLLVDVTDRKQLEMSQGHLSAIVESSEDAILSKNLDGIIQSWNKGAERLFGYSAEETIGQPVLMLIPPDRHDEEPDILARIRRGEHVDHFETVRRRKDGSLIDISLTISPVRDAKGNIVGASKIARDISRYRRTQDALQQQSRRLATLNSIAKMVASDLDPQRVVQLVTDVATELSGARFGAFFYNVTGDNGESLQLYTLSGAPRSAFEKFGMPRNTAIFGPTFRGEGPVRSDDIRADPRYGKSAPHYGMPAGHLPVVSYLAVPVVSRAGEVLGGLFFGHDQPGVFTQESQDLITGIASHAAIALDNARLYHATQQEVAQRKRAEEAKDLLLQEIKHRVKNTLGTVQAIASQTFRAAPREERDAFGARLRAMSEAHDLLTNQDWGDVSVRALVERAIAPFNPERFTLTGDTANIGASRALLLAMVVHELSTNAVKYGALSVPGGKVTMTWRGQDGRLAMTWQESDGPPVSPPGRKGFGTNLIERALRGEQGAARFDFLAEGLGVRLELPI
jgi:PAS domain S-box-containing protein